jgi:Predicted signal transduction protein
MSEPPSPEKSSDSLEDIRLPPIPRVLPKILDHLHASEFADKEGVLEAIECGSGLERRVLRRINAQLPSPVDNIEQAIGMVGATTSAGIVTKLSMDQLNVLRRGPAGSCIRQLIQHSEATAILARHLLRERPPDGAEEASDPEDDLVQTAFAKGFVHDLGKLVLIYNDPKKGAALYGDNWIEREPEEISERAVERRAFGCDHTEAGAYAATEIGLPSGLVAAAGEHHDANLTLSEESDTWALRAVKAANLFTKAMGASFSGLYAQDVALDWETCARHPAWFHWKMTSTADPETLVKEDFILYSEFFLDAPNQHESTL